MSNKGCMYLLRSRTTAHRHERCVNKFSVKQILLVIKDSIRHFRKMFPFKILKVDENIFLLLEDAFKAEKFHFSPIEDKRCLVYTTISFSSIMRNPNFIERKLESSKNFSC